MLIAQNLFYFETGFAILLAAVIVQLILSLPPNHDLVSFYVVTYLDDLRVV